MKLFAMCFFQQPLAIPLSFLKIKTENPFKSLANIIWSLRSQQTITCSVNNVLDGRLAAWIETHAARASNQKKCKKMSVVWGKANSMKYRFWDGPVDASHL